MLEWLNQEMTVPYWGFISWAVGAAAGVVLATWLRFPSKPKLSIPNICFDRIATLEEQLDQAIRAMATKTDLLQAGGASNKRQSKLEETMTKHLDTTTKLLEGMADHSQRLCAVEAMYGIPPKTPAWNPKPPSAEDMAAFESTFAERPPRGGPITPIHERAK